MKDFDASNWTHYHDAIKEVNTIQDEIRPMHCTKTKT